MAHNVKVQFRGTIPGVGFTQTGTAVNQKALVVGHVKTTDVQSGLESVAVEEFGLETIDFIKLNIRSASGGAPAKSATTSVHADWDDVNNRLVICDVAAAGDRAAITNDEDPIVEFLAVGDSALAPELT
jgi:hypothetical protein